MNYKTVSGCGMRDAGLEKPPLTHPSPLGGEGRGEGMSVLRMTLVLLLLFPVAACGARKKAISPPTEIEVSQVVRASIERTALFTGNVVAENAFDVFPRATGKISKKLLKEGDPVKRGQAILMVERDEVGFTFKPMPIVSLVDGLVGNILVDVGAYVDPQHPVATVVHPDKMRIKLDVPERYLDAMTPGTNVSMAVDYLDGKTFEGTIATKSPVIDHKTRTANVEVLIPNSDGRLRHGMFGRMDLVVERHDSALIVPLGAISWEGDKQFAYRYADGKVSRMQVRTGIRNETRVEILEGLAEGDSIAVGSLLDLGDGEAVTVKTRDPTPETRDLANHPSPSPLP